MTPLTPDQHVRRARFESVIRLAAPFLDLVLVVGERVARIAGPEDEYIPIRAPGDAFELGTAHSARRRGEGADD
jgi:hypothetical protein